MKLKTMQQLAAAIACAGMISAPVTAATPATAQSHSADVALSAGGSLTGQLVTAQGVGLSQTQVAIYRDGKEVAHATTDQTGAFRVDGLRGGVYDVVAPGYHGQYRLWSPDAAPPAANHGLLMVAGDQAVLGQNCGPYGACGPAAPACGACGGPFAAVTGWVAEHPLMTAGIIAAAIAIPLAIDDDDDAS